MKYLGTMNESLDLYQAINISDYWFNKEKVIDQNANAYVVFDRMNLKPLGPLNFLAFDKTGTLQLAKTHLLRNYEIVKGEQMMFLKCDHPLSSPQLYSTNNLAELEKIAAEANVSIFDLFRMNLAFNGA